MHKDKQEGGWTSSTALLIYFLLITNAATIYLLEVTTAKLEAIVHQLCEHDGP